MKSHIFAACAFISVIFVLQSVSATNDLQQTKSGNASTLYSWETPHATILSGGDLQWAPLPFVLEKGTSIRYIDFDGGNDNNNGLTTTSAWKHHPWDAAATGTALAASGIQTYIFKRGVIYRGALTAKESGAAGNPIRLTSDPAWGPGEAAIYGSVMQTGGWAKSNATISPNIPNPTSVWYKTIGGLENLTKVVCEITPTGIKRVRLARTPNFEDTPAEPMQKWWSFTAKVKGVSPLQLTDTKNLVQADVNYYKGGDVWAIEDVVTMCTMWRQKIDNYIPSTNSIYVSDINFGGKNCKYYTENTPYMLDVPGEYYYDGSRIFIRLEGDKDPNSTTVEIASKSNLITMASKNYIEISGLTFGFTTYNNVRMGDDGIPAIKMSSCSNMVVKNCKFQYLNGGIVANGVGNNIVVSDNEMNAMDDFCYFSDATNNVSILRNKVLETGTRHLGRWYSSISAIRVTASQAEIAGNIIEYSWGSGINATWGKGDASTNSVPFIRGFVHHNKVAHSLQGVNDYGGIESWQGGPVYTYNNISEDAQGWHYDWNMPYVSSLGYPFYFDGAFKQYVFNNIVKGTGWAKTAVAFNQVLGYYNTYAHNVGYNVGSLTGSGDNNLAVDGGNYYLANVCDSSWHQFDHTTRASGIPYETFGNNLFSGRDFIGNFLSPGGARYSFSQFYDKLNSYKPDLGQVGFETSARVFENPSQYDFRPTANSELIDQGVKFFAPFPLSAVVGEWHFQKHKADSTIIKGENFYLSSDFTNRETYKTVPKNNLKAYGLNAGSFVKGALEDFADAALVFDGVKTYCSAFSSSLVCNSVNMITNNTILESYFKTNPGTTQGTLLAKYGATGYGYQLSIEAAGSIQFDLMNNGASIFGLSGSKPVNDGNWHHVLVETNRQTKTSTIYIDGVIANGISTGTIPPSANLSSGDELLIGKNINGNFFAGTIDYLRISKGTLADAKTTIEELYKWQFDGPFLKDFAGNSPIGKRDAGALERGEKLCQISTSTNVLEFGLEGGSKTFTVNADQGFSIAKKLDISTSTRKNDTYFQYAIDRNTVTVTAPATSDAVKRTAEVWLLGCNETKKVQITQQVRTAIPTIQHADIHVMPNPVSQHQTLTISLPDLLKPCKAIITDLNGRLMDDLILYSGNNNYTVNFKSGIYLLNIYTDLIYYRTKMLVK